MRKTERKPGVAGGRSRLSSVANSLRLLKAFSDEDAEIGISALAQRLGYRPPRQPQFQGRAQVR